MAGSAVEKRGSGATACDSCRRRKRKCVWSPDAERCAPCIASKDDCATTHIRKPRAKSMKRINRIAEYENRIQRLESLLTEQTAAQPVVTSQPLHLGDIQSTLPLSDWVSNLNNTISSWPLEEGPHLGPTAFDAGYEGFLDDFDTSGFHISPGFEDSSIAFTGSPEESITIPHSHHSSEILTDSSVYSSEPSLVATSDAQLYSQTNTTWPLPNTQNSLNPDFPTQVRTPITHIQPSIPRRAICDGFLPSPSLGTSLLKEFLLDFNTAMPLFQPYALASHLRICYAGASDGTVVSWSSAYIVFGIAHRLRAMGTGASRTDNEQADYYMRRVINNVTELLMDRPSLGGVQCLLGLAYLIQTSSQAGPTPHATFVSTALRMAMELAHATTPHSPYPHPPDSPLPISGNPEETEHQYKINLNRTFWLSFILDTEARLLTPSFSTLPLTTTPIPSPHPPDCAGTMTAAEGTWSVNIFALSASLSAIQSDLLSHIASSSPLTHSSITARLTQWRSHELFTLTPMQITQLLYRSDIVHVVRLEASYFATLFRIHAYTVGPQSVVDITTRNPFSTPALRALSSRIPRGFPSHVRASASRFLALVASTGVPVGDYGIYWAIKLSLVAALVILLSGSSPTGPTASDVGCEGEEGNVANTVALITAMAAKSNDVEFVSAKDLCCGLFERRRGVGYV